MHRFGTPSTRRTSARVGLALAVSVVGHLLIAPAAEAATTLTVSTTADVSHRHRSLREQRHHHGTEPLSLREATCLANNIGGVVTINLPVGTYNLTFGELQIGKATGDNVTLSGAGQASTIIDAGGLSRVLDLDPKSSQAASRSASPASRSAAAPSPRSAARGSSAAPAPRPPRDTLTISNSTITNNRVNSATTNKPGGGLQFIGGSLTITNSTVSDNSSGSSPGSGVFYSARGTALGEQLTVSGTTFSGNNANASVAAPGGAHRRRAGDPNPGGLPGGLRCQRLSLQPQHRHRQRHRHPAGRGHLLPVRRPQRHPLDLHRQRRHRRQRAAPVGPSRCSAARPPCTTARSPATPPPTAAGSSSARRPPWMPPTTGGVATAAPAPPAVTP